MYDYILYIYIMKYSIMDAFKLTVFRLTKVSRFQCDMSCASLCILSSKWPHCYLLYCNIILYCVYISVILI